MRLIVLVRLLTLEDIGLFGIAAVCVSALERFTATGFDLALIQRKDNVQDYLDVAWSVQVVRGLALAGLTVAIAPAVGWFFAEPRVVALLWGLAVATSLRSLRNIGIVLFQKELEFHKKLIYEAVIAVVSLAVGVTIAIVYRSVWALVGATVAGALASLLMSYLLHPYRPRFCCDVRKALELFHYGKWVFGAMIAHFLTAEGDDLFVGKVLGAAHLGVYRVAYQLSNAIATEFTSAIESILIPSYSKIQGETERLRHAFLDAFEAVSFVSLPVSLFLILAAPQLVTGLLGDKWAAAVLPIQIMAVLGFIRSVVRPCMAVFFACGQPKKNFYAKLSVLAVLVLTIYPLTRAWGITGTSMSVTLGYAAMLPLCVGIKGLLDLSWSSVLRALVPSGILGACVVLAVLTALSVPTSHVIVQLAVEISAAAVLCAVASVVMARVGGVGPYRVAMRAILALGSK